MLKRSESAKELEGEAVDALRQTLCEVPAIQDLGIEIEPPGSQIDFIARFHVGDRPYVLIAEVKASGQPRHVRSAIHELKFRLDQSDRRAAALFVAPYLSEEARSLCREYDVSFLDLEGNCRIALGTVFVERTVPTKPIVARRDLKSLFKPKSAQVLRVLLRAPDRAWKVVDLAETGGVSLGHVSNVRTALVNREWATVGPEGLQLTAPNALLDAWRDQYESPPGSKVSFYTSLHGAAFDKAVRAALGDAGPARALLASFSAAQWIAPFARSASHYFYADEAGLDQLRATLQLSSVSKGENVTVTRLVDGGLFLDAMEPAPGVFTTSPVQTYLDLAATGERGREAAEHLRREVLAWPM